MSIITYPLNGVYYDAGDVETYLCTRKSGVYSADNNFAVSVAGDRKITIGPGLAWINNAQFTGKSVLNDSDVALDVALANGTLPRIDRVVLRFDKAANASDIVIKQGSPASSPAAPAIEQNELIYELGLYTIYVAAASLTVSIADITSTMLDETVCGLMTDGVTGLPTAHFESQWKALMVRLKELFGDAVGVVSVNGKTGEVSLTAADVGALTSTGTAANAAKLDGKTLKDVMLSGYPVGSLYISTASTSPASLFGGTWEQIKDRFLMAAGSTYSAGSTGGSATRTITNENLPYGTIISMQNTSGTSKSADSAGWGLETVSAGSYFTSSCNWLSANGFINGVNKAFSTMPPYVAVYVWKRVS